MNFDKGRGGGRGGGSGNHWGPGGKYNPDNTGCGKDTAKMVLLPPLFGTFAGLYFPAPWYVSAAVGLLVAVATFGWVLLPRPFVRQALLAALLCLGLAAAVDPGPQMVRAHPNQEQHR